jgi:hypothetical protein
MDRVGYSMGRQGIWSKLLGLGVGVLAVGMAVGGCGDDKMLDPNQVKTTFDSLPYKVTFKPTRYRPSGESIFRGIAKTPRGHSLAFAISVGDSPRPVPVPLSGTKTAAGLFSLGFVFNDNSEFVRATDTPQSWKERVDMAVDLEQSLCRAATGNACPI